MDINIHVARIYKFFLIISIIINNAEGNRLQDLLEENKLDPMQAANLTFCNEIRNKLLAKYLNNENFSPIQLKDLDLMDIGYSLKLDKIELSEMGYTYISNVEPNLLGRFIQLETLWSNIKITASYQLRKVNSSDENHNKLCVTIRTVKVDGSVGLKPEQNTMQTSNFDLHLYLEDPRVYCNDCWKNTIEIFEKSIIHSVQREIHWNLDRVLRQQLNKILEDVPLDVVFNHNNATIERFKSSSTIWNNVINSVMDSVITLFTTTVKQLHLEHVTLPVITNDFAVKSLLITTWGHIELSNVTFGDFSTLKRTGDSSVFGSIFSGELNLFTSGGMEVIKFHVPSYSISLWKYLGTSGEIQAFTNDVSIEIAINVTVNVWNTTALVTGSNLVISNMGKVKVSISRATFLFDWLLSILVTFVINFFHQNMINLAESSMNDIVRSIVINKDLDIS